MIINGQQIYVYINRWTLGEMRWGEKKTHVNVIMYTTAPQSLCGKGYGESPL